MLRRTLITLALAAPGASLTAASEPAAIELARRVANDWLRLVDSGAVSASWEQAAAAFKRAVTQQQWNDASAAVRAPLGSPKKRQEKSAMFTRTMPGAPDGQYVVLQYETSFENKAAATETVSLVLDTDASWRVTGYFIR
jgi:hypothetical protein